MKKDIPLVITKTETIIFVALICWIVASVFVKLPEISSLGM
jgi:hypothetical protein